MASTRKKKCRECGEKFAPTKTTQRDCSWPCALKQSKKRKPEERKKVHRRIQRDRKEKLKTRSELAAEVQREFNRYIRVRDRFEGCISCGTKTASKYDSGHYRSVGAAPELRFDPLNCHKQCVPCNHHRSGNIVEYRLRLKTKIGEASLEWLEGPHPPKKYTADELRELKRYWKSEADALVLLQDKAQNGEDSS